MYREGLEGVPKDDAYDYWAARGGTPLALEPRLSPIPVGLEEAFWIRLSGETVGGESESGYPTPQTLETVIRWYREAISEWFESFHGVQGDWESVFRCSRWLLRQFAAGRHAAFAEEQEES